MKYVVWLMVIGLVIAHQDNWNWTDDTLVFGFIPKGLFYHACISLGAAFTWYLATVFAWPDDLEEATLEAVETGDTPATAHTTEGGAK